MTDRDDSSDEDVKSEALEEEAREGEEEGTVGDERVEAETTSQDRLDAAAKPEDGAGGKAPYPPKPA